MSSLPVLGSSSHALTLLIDKFAAKSPQDPAALIRQLAKTWRVIEAALNKSLEDYDSDDSDEEEDSFMDESSASSMDDGSGSYVDEGSDNDGVDRCKRSYKRQSEDSCSKTAKDRDYIHLRRCLNAIEALTPVQGKDKKIREKFLDAEGLTTCEFPEPEQGDRPEALVRYVRFAQHCRDLASRKLQHKVDTFLEEDESAAKHLKCANDILDLCYAIRPRSLFGIQILDIMELTPASIGKMSQDDKVILMAIFTPSSGDQSGSVHRLVPSLYACVVDVIVESIIPGLE